MVTPSHQSFSSPILPDQAILGGRYTADAERRNRFPQVIRNISMWTFQMQEAMDNPQQDYRERTLWDPFVEPLLDLATETESHDLLVEVSTSQPPIHLY